MSVSFASFGSAAFLCPSCRAAARHLIPSHSLSPHSSSALIRPALSSVAALRSLLPLDPLSPFQDSSEKCREMAIRLVSALVDRVPDCVYELMPYAMPTLLERRAVLTT